VGPTWPSCRSVLFKKRPFNLPKSKLSQSRVLFSSW